MALPVVHYLQLIGISPYHPTGLGDRRYTQSGCCETGGRELLSSKGGGRVRSRNSSWLYQPGAEQGSLYFVSHVCLRQFFHLLVSCGLCRIILNTRNSATIPHPGNETTNAQINVPGVQ